MNTCALCDRKARCRGLCQRCWRLSKSAGTLEQFPRVRIKAFDDRFFSKVAFPSLWGACWKWIGGVNNTGGYGQFAVGYKMLMAHRVSYTMAYGEIPVGLQIDHLCRVRRCVNPMHLEAVTQRENIFRGEAPTVVNAAKTHCLRGHEFTPENTWKNTNGRGCRACRSLRRRKVEVAR